MATVRVVAPGSRPWRIPVRFPITGDESFDEVPDDDPRSVSRPLHPGSDVELQLTELRVPPNVTAEVHAHTSDEIIYVLAGELILGARTIGPGGSVYIPAQTLYGFSSGPDGLHFLNFRGHKDQSYIRKDEFLAARAQAAAGPGVGTRETG